MKKKLTIGGLVSLVLFVIALVVGCSSSNNTPTSPSTTPPTTQPPAAGADVTITIVGMNGNLSFSPNPATVKVGQTVAWRNGDSITHTATGNAGTFDTGNIGAGATSNPITMTTAGSFDYRCLIHPSMVGTLNVTQ